MKRISRESWFGIAVCLALVGCGDDSSAEGGGTEGAGTSDQASSFGDGAAGSGGPMGTTSPGGTTGDDPSGSESDTAATTGAGPDSGDAEPQPDDSGAEESSSSSSTGEPACDDQSPVELFLSPDDSNSMSSPVQVRDAVLGGWSSPASVPIRTWEFLNYYGFDYPPAGPGELTVVPSLYHDNSMEDGEYLLQIGVASEEVADEDRAPMNITLVLDTSGSMSGHPIEMLKESCRAIARSLREGDIISMVTWSTENAVILAEHAVSGPGDETLSSAIEAIESGGGTNLHGGLTAGYELALAAHSNDRINRVVLISDGGANAGVTDIDIISDNAGSQGEDGIYMVGVGVGTGGSYHDGLMDSVTDAGKGASVFINSAQEATKIFETDFVNTMDVAARDVQVRLDLPPGFEIVRFSGEEFSANPDEVEPQHIAPNDAMVFHQRVATCAPDLVDEFAEVTVAVRYKNAVTFEDGEIEVTATFDELLGLDSPQLLKGAAVFAYAEALKAHKKGIEAPFAPALEALDIADEALPDDPDLAEIREVVEEFAAL